MLLFTLPTFLMGKAIARLVESTAQRLRYELTTDGTVDESLVISNSGAPSPDLKTDSLSPTGAFLSPLGGLVEAPVVSQDQARAVLMGHQNIPGAPSITAKYRAHMTLTPRNVPAGLITVPAWCVDANEGAAAGDPASAGRVVVVVQGPPAAGYIAELDIAVPHAEAAWAYTKP